MSPRTLTRKDRLIDATRRLLGARGAGKLAVEEVAAAAGCAKGAVYLEFPSKTALVEAAIEAALDDARVRYAARVCDVGSPHALLMETLRFVWDQLDADPLFARLVAEEGTEGTLRRMAEAPQHVAHADAEIAGLQALGRAGIAAGELRSDLDVEALPFVVSLLRYLHFHVDAATAGRMPRERVLDALLSILDAGLRPRSGG